MEIGYTQAPHRTLPVVFDSPRNRGLKDFPIKCMLVRAARVGRGVHARLPPPSWLPSPAPHRAPAGAWGRRTPSSCRTGGGAVFFKLSVYPSLSLFLSLRFSVCVHTQSCPTLCNALGCRQPGSSVRGILQARILEWAVVSSSRGSSRPRDQTRVSCTGGGFFTAEPPGEPFLKLLFYVNFLFQLRGLTCGILVPSPGIKPALRVLEPRSLSP